MLSFHLKNAAIERGGETDGFNMTLCETHNMCPTALFYSSTES